MSLYVLMMSCTLDDSRFLTSMKSVERPIIIDGEFDDWGGTRWWDAPGDGDTAIDLLELRTAHDAEHLFLALSFAEPVDLDAENWLTLVVDADGDPTTGHPIQGVGSELTWYFGQRWGWWNTTAGNRSLSAHHLGVVVEPTTHAERFELAIPMATTNPALVLYDDGGGDRLPDWGAFTETIEVPTFSPRPLPPPPEGGDRLVTWNVFDDAPFDPLRSGAVDRIVGALQPSILMLQEASDPAQAYAEWATTTLGGTWAATQSGDRIVASRHPVYLLDGPDSPRTMAAAIDRGEQGWLVAVNVHLSCCNYEDERLAEAEAVRDWLLALAHNPSAHGLPNQISIIVAGDFNLVGESDTPLQMMSHGTAQGRDLHQVPATHLHAGMTWTWQDPHQIRSPARLDRALIDENLYVMDSFVVSVDDWPEAEQAGFGLLPGDGHASDHLPVVIDLR